VVHGLPVLVLGDLKASANECSLYCLFAAVRLPKVSGGRKKGFHLRLFSTISILGEKNLQQERACRVLGVFRGKHLPKEITSWERREWKNRGLIVPAFKHNIPTSLNPSFQGHQINPDLVNYNQIKGWLNHCQSFHSAVCGLSVSSLPFRLSCIDCSVREIVSIHLGDEYLTLSYVVSIIHQSLISQEYEYGEASDSKTSL
jgi:hypothetical protein